MQESFHETQKFSQGFPGRCGHPGGALGLSDIFSVLYFDVLRHRPEEPLWEDRDRLILSNGHVCAVRYAAMALSGYMPEEELLNFRKLGSVLQGHPSTRYLPSVENSSGSLGQGLSVATGLSLGAKLQKKGYRTFCGISDGECGEGMTWEAAASAAHHKAPVIAFVDYNGIQIDGFIKDVLDLRDLRKKFDAYGWKTYETDGHDIASIRAAFVEALAYNDGPQILFFRTVLGKGVSFMENNPAWHGKAPDRELMEKALQELTN